MAYTPVGTTIYSGLNVSSYADLDTGIGSITAICRFLVIPDTNKKYDFKPGWDGVGSDPHPETWFFNATVEGGCNAIDPYGLNIEHGIVSCITDDRGHVRWKSNSATGNVDIILVGYMEVTPIWGAAARSGTMPVALTTIDVSGTFSGTGLAFLKWTRTAGGYSRFTAVQTGLTPLHTDLGRDGGVNIGYHPSLAGYAVGTSTPIISGNFDLFSFGYDTDTFIGGVTPDWSDDLAHASNPIYPSASKSSSYEELDLSAIVNFETVVHLMIENTGASASTVYFRPVGSSDNYRINGTATGLNSQDISAGKAKEIEIVTDSSGKIEWASTASTIEVTVLGHEGLGNVGPTIRQTYPHGIDVSRPNDPILFTSVDPDDGVDINKIDLKITDPSMSSEYAILNGVDQAGYTSSIAANADGGYDVALLIHPAWTPGTWQAEATVEDLTGVSVVVSWSWVVEDVPTVSGYLPGWAHSGAEVYDAALVNVPGNLIDLTTDTGGNPTNIPTGRRVFVHLEYAATGFVAARAVSGHWEIEGLGFSQGGRGGSLVAPKYLNGDTDSIFAVTDKQGRIQLWSTSTPVATVVLNGWTEIDDNVVSVHNGVLAGSYSNILTGMDADSFAFAAAMETGGSEPLSVRKDGDVYDYHAYNGGTSRGDPQSEITDFLSIELGASGIFEAKSNSGALSLQMLIIASVINHEGWTTFGNTIYSFAAPPLAWTTLDTGFGHQTLVKLRIKREVAVDAGSRTTVAVRTKGSTKDFLSVTNYPHGGQYVELDAGEAGIFLVETNSDGEIEWLADSAAREMEIDFVGAFNNPPYIENETPTVMVTNTVPIGADCGDDFEIDATGIDLVLTDPSMAVIPVIVAGVDAATWTFTKTPNADNGFDIISTAHPVLDSGLWSAQLTITDVHGEETISNWSFMVDMPPTIEETGPIVGIEHSSIYFSLRDDISIDVATLAATLTSPSGVVVPFIAFGSFLVASNFDGDIDVNTHNGFDVKLTDHPKFESGAWQVDVTVDDVAGHNVSASWSLVISSTNVSNYIGS